VILILLALIAVFVILAAYLDDLLRCVISLAAASVLLAVLIYQWGMPYAAVFELSIAAGLITVLFITTISLVRPLGQYERDIGISLKDPDSEKLLFAEDARETKMFKLLPIAVLAFVIILWRVKGSLPQIRYVITEHAEFAETLWKTRSIDLVGQIIIILCGVFLVILFFKERRT